MRQLFKLQTLLWALYASALFLIYHLLVKIAFLDGSWVALVIFVPLLLGLFFIIHPEERRQVTVFTVAFLLLDRALTRLDDSSAALWVFGGAVAVLGISLLAKWYGKLAWNAVLAFVVIAVIANTTFNRDNLPVLGHFYVKWESDKLYRGEWVDYFPITLYDVDHDGKQDVVTYGNYEETEELEKPTKPNTEEERKSLAEKLLRLQSEPVVLYAYTYKDGRMQRLKEIATEDLSRIQEQLPVDYPGFPYYVHKDGQLVPNVQRQPYTEAMMQFGTTPYNAFLLDMQNLDQYLKQNKGIMDQRHTFQKESKFSNVAIQAGELRGLYEGKPFAAAADATKILGTMRLSNGMEGLLVLGKHISVLTVDGQGQVNEAYTLEREQINGLASAELIVADIDHDQTDELLVANTPSFILKPQAEGKWEVLWRSDKNDEAFRFAAYGAVGNVNNQPEILARAKSWVSNDNTRYLTGFSYGPDGLKQNWKMYLPLINVQVGDVDGDSENEIVASLPNSHRVLVLKRHNLPVLPFVSLLFVGMIGYAVVRRLRYDSRA